MNGEQAGCQHVAVGHVKKCHTAQRTAEIDSSPPPRRSCRGTRCDGRTAYDTKHRADEPDAAAGAATQSLAGAQPGAASEPELESNRLVPRGARSLLDLRKGALAEGRHNRCHAIDREVDLLAGRRAAKTEADG